MSIDLGPLSGRSNARALSAALETLAHSTADADEPLAAACCNFLNSSEIQAVTRHVKMLAVLVPVYGASHPDT